MTTIPKWMDKRKGDRRQYNEREIAALLIEGAKEMKEHIESQASVGGESRQQADVPEISECNCAQQTPDLIEQMAEAIYSHYHYCRASGSRHLLVEDAAQAAWDVVKERMLSDEMDEAVFNAIQDTGTLATNTELNDMTYAAIKAMLKNMEGV